MALENKQVTNKVPLGVKISYGAGEGGVQLLLVAHSIYFLVFLTDVVGISASLAGLLLALGHMWDGISDPAMGIISDRTKFRSGRRRPYILGAALPLTALFWLLFTKPNLEGTALSIYFVIILMLFFVVTTVLYVPYSALLPEMTKDYNERTILSGHKGIWFMIGSIISSAGMLMIVAEFENPITGWSVAGAILGLLALIPFLLTWRFTRGWERHATDTVPFKFKEVVQTVLGNRSFRYLAAIFLFGTAFLYGFNASVVYFFGYYLQMSEDEISLFFLILFACCLFWIPLITMVANRLGKRNSYIIFVGLSALFCGVGWMVVQPGQLAFVYILAVVNSSAFAATFQLVWAMVADVVEVDEFKTGSRREGLYWGVLNLMLKFGFAFSLILVSQYLDIIGYVPNVEQSSTVLWALRWMQGPIYNGIMLISVVFAFFMPMTQARYNALLKAIEAKKAGQQWDEVAIAKLV